MSILSKAALLNQIAALSGVGKWDLVKASYNGCSFMTLKNTYDSVNPLSGVVDAAGSNSYVQSIFGTDKNTNPNANLYATTMSIMGINDNLKRKYVRFKNPGGVDVIQDFGWQGSKIQMNAIFSGVEYLNALSNFLNAAQANSAQDLLTTSAAAKYLVLDHPIYGIQEDVYLVDIQLSYSSQANQAVSLMLTFECTTSISIDNSRIESSSIMSQASKIFQQMEEVALGLSQTIGLANVVVSKF